MLDSVWDDSKISAASEECDNKKMWPYGVWQQGSAITIERDSNRFWQQKNVIAGAGVCTPECTLGRDAHSSGIRLGRQSGKRMPQRQSTHTWTRLCKITASLILSIGCHLTLSSRICDHHITQPVRINVISRSLCMDTYQCINWCGHCEKTSEQSWGRSEKLVIIGIYIQPFTDTNSTVGPWKRGICIWYLNTAKMIKMVMMYKTYAAPKPTLYQLKPARARSRL